MSKAVPWSIKGVDFDVREAAKEAARRDGVSLGEWMNRALAEHACETGASDEDFDADERLEAVAAQLARLSRESQAEDARRARANQNGPGEREQDEDDQDERGPAGRIARDETDGDDVLARATREGRPDYARPATRTPARRPRAPQRRAEEPEPQFEPPRSPAPERRLPRSEPPAFSHAPSLAPPLEKAVVAFESRTERAEARAARALAQVADKVADNLAGRVSARIDDAESERAEMLAQVESRLADLEAHLRKTARSEVEPLRGALGRLETRLEDIARREPEPRDDETLRKLDHKLSNLLSRAERAESAPAPERDERFSRLEKRFDALLARLDRPAPPRAAPIRPARDIKDAIAEISAHQRALDAAPPRLQLEPEAAPRAPLRPSQACEDQIDVLARKLDRLAQTKAAPGEDGRIDRLQSGIEALSARIEDMRGDFSRQQGARDGAAPLVEKALRDLSARIDALAAAQPADALKDVAGLRGEVSGLLHSLGDLAPRGAVAALESSMRDLSKRVDSACSAVELTRSAMERAAEAQTRGGADAQELSRRLADISLGLREVAPRGAVVGIESAMRELSNRVESAREIMARASERHLDTLPDFEALNAQLSGIGRALADVAPRGAVAGVEAAVRDLAGRIDSTREIVSRAAESPFDSAPHFQALNRQLADFGRGLAESDSRGAVAGLEAAVRALSARVDDSTRSLIERVPVRSASADEIEALGRQVAAMSRALEDVAPRSQMAALDLAVRDLGALVERSRDEGLRETLLAPIEGLAADVRLALADIGAAADLDGVVARMRALETKIDDLRRNGAERGDFLKACEQSEALRASIAAALERMAPLDRMEQQVAGLTERLEVLSRQSSEARSAQESGLARSEANWREMGSRIDDLAVRIERAADQRQEQRPGDERRFEELSDRLDFVHQALAERIDGASGGQGAHAPERLEPLLRMLAEKLEHAMAPQADSRAIEALERQVAQVSQQLERGAAGGDLRLQQALAELAARFDREREHDRETVREVARETLREALAHLPAADTRDEQALRDIADLREKHENSDRRAQQTLSAVHETLEKVVDRLAMLEEDVQDARSARPSDLMEQARAARPPESPDASAPRRTAAPLGVNGLDFDPESLLVEPGAGRPLVADDDDDLVEAPGVKLSRDDEAALMSGARSASYIDVARRALAARAESEAQAQAEAPKTGGRGAGAARLAREGGASFMRPLGRGEKRTGVARTGALLAAGASVLALGMFQFYRVALTPAAPPMEAAAPVNPAASQAAPEAPAPETPAPDAPAAAPAPEAAPAKPHGASLLDPLAVGSIGPRTSSMAEIEAGAQVASLKIKAENGDAVAQFDLATRYADGRGFDRDPASAIQWFEKAAAQGQAQAEYRLGVIYEKGVGVARDARKARDYYEKAASRGHVRAMHNLAVIEAEGVDGKPDYASAAQWFRRAAEFGVRDSQFNLAILYARGMGLTQNMTQSYVWFSAAADQGDADAARKRDEVAGRLSASELAAAKRQVAAFHPRAADPAVNDAPATGLRPQAAARIWNNR